MVQLIKSFCFAFVILFVLSCDNGQSSGYDNTDPDGQELSGLESAYTAKYFSADTDCDRGFEHVKQIRKVFLNYFFLFFKQEKAVPASVLFKRDAVLTVNGEEGKVPHAGTYSGRREIRTVLCDYFNDLEITACTVQYHLVDSEYASSHIRIQANVPATGKTVDLEYVFLWKYSGETALLPSGCHIYFDTYLMKQAFADGGSVDLSDLSNPDDDYIVVDTEFDTGQIVRTVYDNFYAGNLETVLGMISPTDTQIFFKGPVDGFTFAGYYAGADGILSFMNNLAGTAVPYNVEMFFVTEGDRTDVVLFEEWTVFATGKDFHVRTVNSWRIDENGKVLGFTSYPDTQNIVEAYTL